MKITDIQSFPIAMPLADRYKQHDGQIRMHDIDQHLVVKVTTNNGIVGYGDEETHHALELVEMMDPPGEYFHGNTYGHVALLVTSVKEISEMLKEQGVEFSLDPHHVRPENPNMLAFIKDPDGYEIELTERR